MEGWVEGMMDGWMKEVMDNGVSSGIGAELCWLQPSVCRHLPVSQPHSSLTSSVNVHLGWSSCLGLLVCAFIATGEFLVPHYSCKSAQKNPSPLSQNLVMLT